MYKGVYGLSAGITWGLDTVLLGIALGTSPFVSTEQAIFLAPFISTFLHDLLSSLFSLSYIGLRSKYVELYKTFRSRGGLLIALAATVGGPIGMTGYVMTVNYMGASIGSVSCAIFPAVGAFLAYLLLGERMRWYQFLSLIIAICGVLGLSYSPDLDIKNFWLGFLGAIMCSVGWGCEAVIVTGGLRNLKVDDECALVIRQTVSALIYGLVVLPLVGGYAMTKEILYPSQVDYTTLFIFAAALVGTLSYIFYYKSLATIGATKSMALNITYSAWSMVFTVILLGDTSVFTPHNLLCAVIIVLGSVFAASDVKELLS